MQEDYLIVPHIRKKKYNSYLGEISPEVGNIINRDFGAEQLNTRGLTDLTEFHISTGKIYLSPMIDCFDGYDVAWTIGVSPDTDLVNNMLEETLSTLEVGEHPIIHSIRGCHYRWPGWIERTNKAGLIRPMSKKGCSPDNSACEGFFGRLKKEFFFCRSWLSVTTDEFMIELDYYMRW